ncbi:MAG: cob(I)yrinic acid a,c-diamide adenosyltransferase [Proteobacteria bacterium]|nr:cob(I)yrinic acid a,c-diamide adenosyltransferase [Pseudomonadota bacterium]
MTEDEVTRDRASKDEAAQDGASNDKQANRQGQLVVYTGNGKGKTTAALGVAFRALGRDFRVAVLQFIKGKWKTGERRFAETLPSLVFEVTGKGFTWESDDLSRDAQAARQGWERAKELVGSGSYDIVILDELTYAINYGFIDLEGVVTCLKERPGHVHVIVTGRNAPDPLLDAADLVTEMKPIKHPYDRGVPAQIGLDY